MIRDFEPRDLEAVMQIWLCANTEAHCFIDSAYWRANYDAVKGMIPKAKVYVSEQNGAVNGFLGIADNEIAGLFVQKACRKTGIGTSLLNAARQDRDRLTLRVYEKNKNALRFYEKSGFRCIERGIDPDTNEPELVMLWERSAND